MVTDLLGCANNKGGYMQPNYNKLAFSRSMTTQDGGFITSSVCHNYGIISGCDEGCPALLSGDCKNINDVIGHCSFTEEEKTEVLKLYK